MIIPDNLSPFPTLPQSYDSTKASRIQVGSFVCDDAIQEILMGPMLVTPLVTTRVPNGGGYAGRDDIANDNDSPFATVASCRADSDTNMASVALPRTAGPHPALANPRFALAPTPRIEPERAYGRRDRSDRWWVLGMGVALLAIVGSGALVELISNEAVRRSRISLESEEADIPAKALPSDKVKTESPALVISNPEYPAP